MIDPSYQDHCNANYGPEDEIDLLRAGFNAYFDECTRRFDVICRAAPKCKCGTFQVQVIKTSAPAVWKCRICKTIWEFEPEASTLPSQEQLNPVTPADRTDK